MPTRTPKAHDLASLGEAVRQLREKCRLSQGDLAVAIGVEVRRVQALEAGQLDPDYLLLLVLAEALGVRAGALVIRAEGLAKRGWESEPEAD